MPIIAGQVLDKEYQPIKGIWVRIYRGHDRVFGPLERIDQAFTDQNGRYEITGIAPGSPLTIRYDDRRFLQGTNDTHPALVNLLSGVTDHTINKVLYNVAVGYSLDELLDILSTYERLYFTDTADFIPLDNELRRTYPEKLAMIKSVDELTKQRLQQVSALYKPQNP